MRPRHRLHATPPSAGVKIDVLVQPRPPLDELITISTVASLPDAQLRTRHLVDQKRRICFHCHKATGVGSHATGFSRGGNKTTAGKTLEMTSAQFCHARSIMTTLPVPWSARFTYEARLIGASVGIPVLGSFFEQHRVGS